MKVERAKDLGEGYLLEAGRATWDESQTSIRDRYPTRSGGFNPHSSSEIPLADISELAVVAVEQNLLSQIEFKPDSFRRFRFAGQEVEGCLS